MKKFLLFIMVLVLVFSMSILSFAEVVSILVFSITDVGQNPIPLNPGTTLGQTFTTTANFNQIDLVAPTWGAKENSIFTFIIRKDSPTGMGLYTIDFTNVKDNTTKINFPTMTPGVYYIEMSNGDADAIGWWQTTADTYADGTAFADGEAVLDVDNKIFVNFIEGLTQTEGLKVIVEEVATQSPVPTQTPISTVGLTATNTPLKTQMQVSLPSPTITKKASSNSLPWVIGSIIGVAVIGAGIATFIILKKKK